ncbi:MAG: hypothetical protein IT449_00510 [Phycisphaerales bacterium]|nr:hypothetical protein [Phycisphaerales bacterium]
MAENAHRHDRQQALLELVRLHPLANQRELVNALRERGFETTQASMSRDIRDLGLVKVGGRYRRLEDLGEQPEGALAGDPVFELVKTFEPVGANLIVLRTATGAANSVAVLLDQQRMPQVVGTLAGDDTVFIAVRSRSDQGRVVSLLNRLVRRERGRAR